MTLEKILKVVETNPSRAINVKSLETGMYLVKLLDYETAVKNYGSLNGFFEAQKEKGNNRLEVTHVSKNGSRSSGKQNWRKRESIKIDLSPSSPTVTTTKPLEMSKPHQAEIEFNPNKTSLGGHLQAANMFGLNGTDILKSFTVQDRYNQLLEDHARTRENLIKAEIENKSQAKEIAGLEKELMLQEIKAEKSKNSPMEQIAPLFAQFAPVAMELLAQKKGLNAPTPTPAANNGLAGIIENLPPNSKKIIELIADNKLQDNKAFAMIKTYLGYDNEEFQNEFLQLLTKYQLM